MEAHPPLVGRRNPWGARQVEGRHPYLVTRAAVLSVPFTPTSRELKMSESVTSAGTSHGCYADEVLTCDYSQ